MESRRSTLRAGFLVFDGVDGLDFAGPLEIFLDVHYGIDYTSPDPAFNLTIIAPFDLILTSAAVKIIPDASIASARSKLGESDILVVPGGQPPIVFVLIESNSEVLQIVRDFRHLSHKDTTDQPRTILSIYTRTLFLGVSSLLSGLSATTYHLFLDSLRAICEKEAKTHVVQARYVDGGLRKSGLRVVTGGGRSFFWPGLGLLFCFSIVFSWNGLVCGQDVLVEPTLNMGWGIREIFEA